MLAQASIFAAPEVEIQMKRTFITLALVAAGVASASADFIVNGDFSLTVPSNGTGNGWTSFNVDGAGGWRSSGGNPGGMFILNDNGNTTTNPSIQQSISGLTVGVVYQISGDETVGNASNGSNLDFGVEIDNHLWEYNIPTASWLHFSETFVASSTTATLLVTGERHADNDPRIDNLSLVAVPEPASIILFGAGALAVLKRRRK
jgi:hypothetical protein